MEVALALARKALAKGEVPIGAIVVDPGGTIIGRGFNSVETRGCQCEHAEVRAIRQACKKIGDWRLEGCSLFVTLEPCLMCFGLIALSRIKNLYFGAHSPLFGVGNIVQLDDDKRGSSSLIGGVGEIAAVYRKWLSIHGGLKAQECADILSLFFEKARAKRG